MKFAFISKTGGFPIAWMCRRLGVSTSGFHAWRRRETSSHARRDDKLRSNIRVLHTRSRQRYGSPRIYADLVSAGERVSRKRIARLIREMGLCGRTPKRWKRPTVSNHDEGYSPNLVRQDFSAARPNALWLADISYISLWVGWVYLAVVIDAFSRRVVGYAIDNPMRASLAVDALEMAIRRRRPLPKLIHHSDRGGQYASKDYRKVLARIHAQQSMSSPGNCYDNAAAESFFATLKSELMYRHSWPTQRGVSDEIRDDIENFYNRDRRHSKIGGVSPVDYEFTWMQHSAA